MFFVFFFFKKEMKQLFPQIPAFSDYKAHYATSSTSVALRFFNFLERPCSTLNLRILSGGQGEAYPVRFGDIKVKR